jgi:ATP-dependent Clp protease ATP-binding subunit ClpA
MTFSDEVEGVLQRALLAAGDAGHAHVTPEHIALELIVEDETATYLERCGTDLVAVESRLREYLERADLNDGTEMDARPSPALERVVEAAMQRAEEDERDTLMLRDLFLGLMDERDGTARVAILEATREPEVFDDLRSYPWEEE